MKRFEKKLVTPPPRETEELVEVHCFACGDPAPQPQEHGEDSWDRGGWTRGGYNIEKVVLRHEDGSHFPHSGRDIKVTEFDCCPKCWEEKVLPFLLTLGEPDRYELLEGKRYG